MSTTRREFLKATLGTSTLVSFGPQLLARAAESRRDRGETILVVVQLSGGNDGLNTVVPYTDDEYARNRTTLRLPTDKLHKIDDSLGFHPRMEAFERLYKEGHLTIVQGVGYENQNRDHDGGMRDWHTAEPGRTDSQTGWLGRATDKLWNSDDPVAPAMFVGPIALPFGLNAERVVVPSVHTLRDLALRQSPGTSVDGKHLAELPRADTGNPLLPLLERTTAATRADTRRIEAVAAAPGSKIEYPAMPLAGTLRTVAQLIRAELGVRIFYTELGGGGIGGFDNHANQLGNHCALLHQLSESVAAFVGDLRRDKLLDRVLLMTFSEFGRTVKENGRRGTGHGEAAPVFLAGGRLRGGLLGPHPSLTDLNANAPRFHTDFRRVYA
ncbi:MAG: DUF1501 domain-containing protein, partial [Candidatus Nealsonbacteria bacterium]|nr:DUF1501 domain-containing protein [Candidatus Nealsonbacteria bacterium]